MRFPTHSTLINKNRLVGKSDFPHLSAVRSRPKTIDVFFEAFSPGEQRSVGRSVGHSRRSAGVRTLASFLFFSSFLLYFFLLDIRGEASDERRPVLEPRSTNTPVPYLPKTPPVHEGIAKERKSDYDGVVLVSISSFAELVKLRQASGREEEKNIITPLGRTSRSKARRSKNREGCMQQAALPLGKP